MHTWEKLIKMADLVTILVAVDFVGAFAVVGPLYGPRALVLRWMLRPTYTIRQIVSYDTIFTGRINPIFCRTTLESLIRYNFD
jgi:hypothetical protein